MKRLAIEADRVECANPAVGEPQPEYHLSSGASAPEALAQ